MLSRNFVLLLMCGVLMSACTKKQMEPPKTKPNYVRAAEAEYKGAIRYAHNATKTCVLITSQQSNKQQPINFVRFMLYDQAQNKVVYRSKQVRGTVRWADKRYIEVRPEPGIVKDERREKSDSGVYYIDAVLGRKLSKLPAKSDMTPGKE